ncbi:hypothetical protein GJAV_G00159460 [Gymnothorax javanicus]|nr:hypothetical protein GJAV_G00159460 [Gymnothorax javanicus]
MTQINKSVSNANALMMQPQEIMLRLNLFRAVFVARPGQHLLLCICLMCSLLASDGMECNMSHLHRKKETFRNDTTECPPGHRCYSGRGFYGKSHILSAQGCVLSEWCGTVRPIKFGGVTYSMSYTCCCRDLCNLPPKQDKLLKMLFGKTEKGDVPSNITVNDCPEDNSLPENTSNATVVWF